MSAPQPLQERIFDCLRDNGPIAVREFGNWFQDVDPIVLDPLISRLVRQNSVTLAFGKYELTHLSQPRGNGAKPFVATAVSEAPPSAAAEAAASLAPAAEATAYCLSCNASHPESDFQRSRYGKLYSRCRKSYGAMVAEGKRAAKERREGLERSQGNPSPMVQSKLGSANSPNENPASNTPTEPTTVSLESSHDKQPPVAADSATGRTHTPPPPPGSTEPPAISSATSSEHPAHGTTLMGVVTENPEALSPVGTGDPVLTALAALAHKRAQLVVRRERLTTEYEVNLKGVIERIEEFDRAMELVRTLCGEEG